MKGVFDWGLFFGQGLTFEDRPLFIGWGKLLSDQDPSDFLFSWSPFYDRDHTFKAKFSFLKIQELFKKLILRIALTFWRSRQHLSLAPFYLFDRIFKLFANHFQKSHSNNFKTNPSHLHSKKIKIKKKGEGTRKNQTPLHLHFTLTPTQLSYKLCNLLNKYSLS